MTVSQKKEEMDKTAWVIRVPRWWHIENKIRMVAFDLGLSINIHIDKGIFQKEIYIEIEGPKEKVKVFDDTTQAYIDANNRR